MTLKKQLAASATAALFLLTMSAKTQAGTSFRLEIGPPIAAGMSKAIKDYKKVALVVRPRLCDSLGSVRITGTAEGIVNGARQSIALNLIALDPVEGVYAVQQQWPADGHWVLQLNGTCPSPKASATTLVPMNKGAFIREKTEVLREPATKKQLEAALTALARSQS